MERPNYITKTLAASSLLALLLTSVLPIADAGQPAKAKTKAVAKEEKSTTLFQTELGTGPLVFRDHTGKPIGSMDEDATMLEITVKNGVLKHATTESGLSSMKLLSVLPRTKSAEGKDLVMMQLPQSIKNLQGNVLPPGYPVWVELDELLKPGALQPAGAKANAVADENSTDEERSQVDKANAPAEAAIESLVKSGVSDVQQKNPPLEHEHEDYDEELPMGERNAEIGRENHGRFLSSPTCDCVRGSCRVTSPFGVRTRPRTNRGRGSRYHTGLDIGGGKGTPIVAAADGCVTQKLANRNTPSGLSVQLNHKNGFKTSYSHLNGFAPKVRLGQCFKRGDVIGTMGATGRCSGPHLHFGLKQGDTPVDPKKFMLATDSSALSPRCGEKQDLGAYG